jgi:hypothetical protein
VPKGTWQERTCPLGPSQKHPESMKCKIKEINPIKSQSKYTLEGAPFWAFIARSKYLSPVSISLGCDL